MDAEKVAWRVASAGIRHGWTRVVSKRRLHGHHTVFQAGAHQQVGWTRDCKRPP